MKNTKARLGFTFIELATVVTIIAVAVVFIAGAREIISASKVSEYISGFAYYNNAKSAFEEKYKALPGDVKDVDSFAGNSAMQNVCGGIAGNGKIDDVDSAGNPDFFEQDQFWNQLSYSGLIKQKIDFNSCDIALTSRRPGNERPSTDSNDSKGFTYLTRVNTYPYPAGYSATAVPKVFLNVLRVGGVADNNDKQLSSGLVSIKTAEAIDIKIDQGRTPISGKFFVDEACVDIVDTGAGISTEYKLDRELQCQLNLAEVVPNIPLANLDPVIINSSSSGGGSSGGSIECEDGYEWNDNTHKCEKEDTKCPVGQVEVEGVCVTDKVCDAGFELDKNGNCVKTNVVEVCAFGYVRNEQGICIPFACPPEYFKVQGQCVLKPICEKGTHAFLFEGPDGRWQAICVKDATCPAGYKTNAAGDGCLLICPSNYVRLRNPDGTQYCEASKICPEGFVRSGQNICVSLCKTGYTWNSGTCTKTTVDTKCPVGFSMINGTCVENPKICEAGYTLRDGKCVKIDQVDPIPDQACQNMLKNLLPSLGGSNNNLNTWSDIVNAYLLVGISDVYKYIRDNNICTQN